MENPEEDEITLQEALETQEMLESQSAAVLGASDPQNCSYTKGYMKRQALYACLTCNPKGAPFAQPGGVCLACSYNCHEGHEMVELFTKRNFRCDCGNKKFPDNPCKLQAEKDEVNSNNTYNQNFEGMYCSCHRPYTDPDCENESADDSMIQCIICEDWHHFHHCLKHLNTNFEAMDDDFELICGPCMKRLDFLGYYYADLAVKPTKLEVEDSKELGNESAGAEGSDANASPKSSDLDKEIKTQSEDNCSHDSGVGSIHGTDTPTDASLCPLVKGTRVTPPSSDVNAIAWKGDFRSSLCRCTSCMAMYESLKISYLMDEEDTIEHYEAVGKKNAEAVRLSAEASFDSKVNGLGRVGELELLYGYNQFKEQLAEFLKRHAENGTVVQKDDVTNFFAKMKEEQSAKRRRLE